MNLGNIIRDSIAYKGILLENFVASSFFNLANKKNIEFTLFYDKNKKKNVDFIIQQWFDKAIPIEVGIDKKDKKQVYSAINKYNSDYGIIISNATTTIKKKKII